MLPGLGMLGMEQRVFRSAGLAPTDLDNRIAETEYISDMCLELAAMARKGGLMDLMFILNTAGLEAKQQLLRLKQVG
jgi:hypothetical protein